MRRAAALLVLSLALALPGVGRGNTGPASYRGSVGTELNGLAEVSIADEHLTIDLRLLADGVPVAVEASYQLRNKGDEIRTELVFVSGSSVEPGDAGIWLNDVPVPIFRVAVEDVPKW